MKQGLEFYRAKIDVIDRQLVRLLAERMKLMPEIAKIKKAQGIPVFQPAREKEVIQLKKKLARENGLSEAFVEKAFKLIMKEAKEVQRRGK